MLCKYFKIYFFVLTKCFLFTNAIIFHYNIYRDSSPAYVGRVGVKVWGCIQWGKAIALQEGDEVGF